MHNNHFTPQEAADLLDFLHTLPPPPPLQTLHLGNAKEKDEIAPGAKLFQSLGCANCHVPPLTYTSQESYDVGLVDELGQKKFNPPSLRGVGQGERFLHDSRATTLESVFTIHGHQLSRELTSDELADLVKFLAGL